MSNKNGLNVDQVNQIKIKFNELQATHHLHDLLLDIVAFLPINSQDKKTAELYLKNSFKQGNLDFSYSSFNIKKKSGKSRTIYAPNNQLKIIQKALNVLLSCVFEPHPNTFGFRYGSSIVQNAKCHVNKLFVYNVDLKDFFNSITKNMIMVALVQKPFNLNKNRISIAHYISQICCMKYPENIVGQGKKIIALPQGAPTSPIMSNIVCKRMDIKLHGLAKRFNVKYSRYADDMTFSSDIDVFNEKTEFNFELKRIINSNSFFLNEGKTRLQKNTERQIVTGLIVNKKVNISKSFIKTLRMYLYYWEKYGYIKAELILNKDFFKNAQKYEFKNLKATLRGKLDFLVMVLGSSSLNYIRLKNRFNKLTGLERNILPLGIQQYDDEKFQYHKPKDVASFLRLFQDSSGLKYLTHDYDLPNSEFNLALILDYANKDFNRAFKKYSITKQLYARVKQFAFETEPKWWRWKGSGLQNHIDFGWSTTEIALWCNANQGVHPIRLNKYRDKFITPFKESIQFRPPNLKILIEDSIKNKFGDQAANFNVVYQALESAEFYTDCDIILGGIRHLLDPILSRINISNELNISYKNLKINGYRMKIIEIKHLKSDCLKEAEIDLIMNGNFKDARKMFYGLCNWSVTSKFANGTFKLNIISDIVNCPQQEIIDPDLVDGFTHSLYFY